MKRDAPPSVQRYVLDDTSLRVPYRGKDARLRRAFPRGFPASVGSGICYKSGDAGGTLEFWFVTDRGPNCDAPDYDDGKQRRPAKVFPAPHFGPSLGVLRVQRGKLRVASLQRLRSADGTPVSGRPVEHGAGVSGEVALSDQLKLLPFDANGVDTESVAAGRSGVWIGDEYGPFLLKVDPKSGRILKKLGPGTGLPRLMAQRQPNRGFEALCMTPRGLLCAMPQSTLALPARRTRSADDARFIRMLLLDPKTGRSRMIGYPHDRKRYARSGDGKIGDIVALSETRFVLIEQGQYARDGRVHHRLYLVDIEGASDLARSKIDGKEPEYFRGRELRSAGIQLARKRLLLDLDALGWKAEKAEGLALLPDGCTLAVINDNDYGLAAHIDADGRACEVDGYSVDAQGKISRPGKKDRGPYRYVMKAKPKAEQKTEMFLVTMPEKLVMYEI